MQSIEAANGAPSMGDMTMSAVNKSASPTIQFPYGFPNPGRYRIFVQMKHGGLVETGVFDAEVE